MWYSQTKSQKVIIFQLEYGIIQKIKKYIAGCSFGDGDTKHLGSFDTPEEAFMVYKKVKEKYIKEVAEKYKNKIPLILYKSLIKYEV